MVLEKKLLIQKGMVNKTIVYLTLSDIFSWGLVTILTAIVGIYLAQKFDGSAVSYVGVGLAIYYLFRGTVQLPVSIIVDRIKGEKDDALVLVLGNILMGLPFLLYPTLSSPFFYYILQIILGIGAAMNLVTWRKIFAKSLDKGKEGYDYAIYDLILSLSMVVASIVAGFIANINGYYFDLVIFSIGVIIIASSIFPFLIYSDITRPSAQ